MRKYVFYPFMIFLLAFDADVSAQPLCSYSAKISDNDKKNSAGKSLASAGVSKSSLAALIRQDRANYHQFKMRDAEDEGDCLFSDKQMRAKIEEMINASSIDPKIIESIVTSNPLITVSVYRDKLAISLSEKQVNKKDTETAENTPKDALPEIAKKIFNKKWSLSDLPCNLNGGTYTIYTNQPPTGATEYLAGKKNQSEQRQDFEFRTSDTEKNVLFRLHTIYADGNKFVMQQVGDPNTVVSEMVEKITLQSDQKILITRELKQIDFDQMMAGRVAYTNKTENTFKNLCK